MLLKNVEIEVFNINNESFDSIGQVNEYTSLIWPDKFNGFSQFELNAPVNKENKELLKKGHVVWCGGKNAAFIENILVETKEKGKKVFKVKGRTLEQILTTRIIWGTYSCVNKKVSTAMYEIVNDNCVNPVDTERKIPFLDCAEDDFLGNDITFQETGSEVYETIQGLAADSELGFCVLFKPKEKKMTFKVIKGTDRTSINDPNSVSFSTEMDDILSSSYYTNDQDFKNVALVAGEGEGAERKKAIAGNDSSFGFLRREMYIDARDLQSEISNDDGSTSTIPVSEYLGMLVTRGNEKIAERQIVETFEAKLRVVGDVQYKYGVDYFKGDKVNVYDADIGVLVMATVSEVVESFSDKYSLDITFGFAYPTLFQKIKKQIL